jgi:hypothetical protein
MKFNNMILFLLFKLKIQYSKHKIEVKENRFFEFNYLYLGLDIK